MRISKILLAFIIAVSFSACQKELNPDSSGTPLSTTSKIKTYTEDVTSGGTHTFMTLNLNYDSQNRLISMTSATDPGARFEYHYAIASFTLDLYNSNKLDIHEVSYLNSYSLVDSTLQYNQEKDTTTEKYIYNTAKQLIKKMQYEYSYATGAELENVTNYFYDNIGNVIKETDYTSEYTYEYYPDLVNNFVLGTPYEATSKNLVKTTTSNAAGPFLTFHHVYTLDASKRIISETASGPDGEVGIKTYTYY